LFAFRARSQNTFGPFRIPKLAGQFFLAVAIGAGPWPVWGMSVEQGDKVPDYFVVVRHGAQPSF